MNTLRAPDGREVRVEQVSVVFTDDRMIDAIIVVDDDLAFNVSDYLDDGAWEEWDTNIFFYATNDDWSHLLDGEDITGEWRIVR